MALSPPFVDAHIAEWQARLTSPYYPHRKHWPSHLFHHSPLENAVAILVDGNLRSRNDTANCRPRDVAAPGVIDTRADAHERVRLYFRPKTPTQWHIEGIRKPGECSYGDETHAGVLVMFALDAKAVLALPGTKFSNRNMQINSTVSGEDEAYFVNIPFDKVYSEGNTGGDKSYTDSRCAEVLPKSPLSLWTCLRAIYFRSEPERDTLLNMIGGARHNWSRYCHVSDALKVFQKDYTFVQEIGLTSRGVVFRLNHRRDRQTIKVHIRVWNSWGALIVNFFNNEHAAAPPPPSQNWIWEQTLSDDLYLVQVDLEDTLAYKAHIRVGDSLF